MPETRCSICTIPKGRMKLDSAGLVSALFKVDDTYTVRYEPSSAPAESQMDSKEGKRHRQTAVTYDRNQNRADLGGTRRAR